MKAMRLPYSGAVSSQIGRLLGKFAFRPLYQFIMLRNCFGLVKEQLGLGIPGIYQISCSCGEYYIEEQMTNR